MAAYIAHDVYNIEKDETGYYKRTYIKTDEYRFFAPNDSLFVIQRNSERKRYYKIVPNSEFMYSIQKTQVKANGGAAGLVHFLTSPDWKDHAAAIIENIISNTKEVKTICA